MVFDFRERNSYIVLSSGLIVGMVLIQLKKKELKKKNIVNPYPNSQ